jgi:hypothetical protein
MNAYELADQVEMWGKDLLALNMKGGFPVIEGAKMLRHQADLTSWWDDWSFKRKGKSTRLHYPTRKGFGV